MRTSLACVAGAAITRSWTTGPESWSGDAEPKHDAGPISWPFRDAASGGST